MFNETPKNDFPSESGRDLNYKLRTELNHLSEEIEINRSHKGDALLKGNLVLAEAYDSVCKNLMARADGLYKRISQLEGKEE
jgi:hypothetical protein